MFQSDLEDLLKTSKRKINLEEMGIKPELKKVRKLNISSFRYFVF